MTCHWVGPSSVWQAVQYLSLLSTECQYLLYDHCYNQKNPLVAGCRWLTPLILATQEAEIRKIAV
jgi:hypothetical protein